MSVVPPQPLPALLEALEGQPGLGWVLKGAPSLGYVRWAGAIPMANPRLSNWGHVNGFRSEARADARPPAVMAGQTDADHFDPTQASILRLADLRALRQGQPATELHRIETRQEDDVETAMDWRAWRFAFEVPAPAPEPPAMMAASPAAGLVSAEEGVAPSQAVTRWLLVVWLDLGHAQRQDAALALAQKQIQAQQLLIAQLRAQVPAESDLAIAHQSLAWAAQRFSEQLRREVDLSRREQRSFALILLALREGELDELTEQAVTGLLARQLPLGVRTMDTVTQIAPTRFGILLSGAQLTPAFARAESLRRQAAALIAVGPQAARAVELFIGVAAYPLTAEDAPGVLACAEAALVQALAAPLGGTVLAPVPLSSPGEGAP